MGGDKPAEKLKALDADDVEGYRQALQELLESVSAAESAGKTPKDF